MSPERFRELKRLWMQDTAHLSNLSSQIEHPAYQEMLAGCDASVRLILADMHFQLGHWFHALRTLTGAQPVPEEDAGKVMKMTHHWLRWGRENGYPVHAHAEIWVEVREELRHVAWHVGKKSDNAAYAKNLQKTMIHDLSQYEEYIRHNELELAWKELVDIVNPLTQQKLFDRLVYAGKLLDGAKS